MKVNVTKDTVIITEYSPVNAGERGLNICEFQLPEEFSSLTVTAAFNNVPVPVCDGECIIPTLKKGTAILGVYAYKESSDGVELMYSPKPTAFYVNEGSYTEEVAIEEIPSITEYEKYCQLFAEKLLEKVSDREKVANKTESLTEKSTNEQYPTAKAVYDEFQKFNIITRLEKSGFVNGAFEANNGVVDSKFWIITPYCVRVRIGDIIKIELPEGLKVWWRIFDSDDLNIARNLKNGGISTGIVEYVSEYDGYLNIQAAKTDSTNIIPEDFDGSIIISSSRLKNAESEIEKLKNSDIDILTQVDVDEEHTNEQVYGALAMDEALNVFGEELEKKQNGKVFEEIVTVTVAPDENGDLPTKISITKDKDGNSFNLSDLYCETLIGMTDYSKGRFYVLAGGLALIGNAYLDLRNETLRRWCFRYDSFGEGNGGICTAPAAAIATTAQFPSANNSNLYGQPVPPGKEININKVEFIGQVGEPKTFMEGTTITLWGVRK